MTGTDIRTGRGWDVMDPNGSGSVWGGGGGRSGRGSQVWGAEARVREEALLPGRAVGGEGARVGPAEVRLRVGRVGPCGSVFV